MEMEVQKNSNVSFGTTQDRGIFPTHVPHTRFGNDLTAIRGAPNRGPGAYDNEEVSNFWHGIETKITSNKGYSLGARTASKIPKTSHFLTPAPPAYQTKCTEPKVFTDAYKPFSAATERFPIYKRDVEEISPGAGTYEHAIPKNRKVKWHSSFGGPPINLPAVHQHSTINKNTDKLLSTKEEKKYQRRFAYLKLYYD